MRFFGPQGPKLIELCIECMAAMENTLKAMAENGPPKNWPGENPGEGSF